MRLSILRILSLFLLGLLPMQWSYAGPQDVPRGQAFKKLQDEITSLKSQIVELSDPSAKYDYLEQVVRGDGTTITKFYAFEEYSYDGTYYNDDSFIGRDSLVNALGAFEGSYEIIRREEPHSKTTSYECPNGEEPTPITSSMEWTWRSRSGAIHFTSETPNAGRYRCSQSTPNFKNFFSVYEGRGLGAYSCITKAVYYGLGYGAETEGYELNWETDLGYYRMESGVFKRETNGRPGTNYVEITAPDGCIPEK